MHEWWLDCTRKPISSVLKPSTHLACKSWFVRKRFIIYAIKDAAIDTTPLTATWLSPSVPQYILPRLAQKTAYKHKCIIAKTMSKHNLYAWHTYGLKINLKRKSVRCNNCQKNNLILHVLFWKTNCTCKIFCHYLHYTEHVMVTCMSAKILHSKFSDNVTWQEVILLNSLKCYAPRMHIG